MLERVGAIKASLDELFAETTRMVTDLEARLLACETSKQTAVTDLETRLRQSEMTRQTSVADLETQLRRAQSTSCPDPLAHVVYGPRRQAPPTTTPVVLPETHGAKGDNVTDDTAALQRALDAAEGKTLWLPADKTYLVRRTLSVRSGTRVTGAGPTSVLRFDWRGVDTVGSGGGSNLRSFGTSARDIHLSNFVLHGGGDGLPGGLKATNPEGLVPLLRLIRVTGFSVTRMELRYAEGLSMSLTGCIGGDIADSWVHRSGRDGITQYRNVAENAANVKVRHNLIEKTGDDAIAINGLVPGHNLKPLAGGLSPLPTGIEITDNLIRGWGKERPAGWSEALLGRGIALNGVAGALVARNHIENPNGTGILLTGCNSHICAGSSTDWWSENAEVVDNLIIGARGGSRPGAITVIKTRNSTIARNRRVDSDSYNFAGALGCRIEGNV